MSIRALVYTAGPYTASTPTGIRDNIRRAEEASITLWNLGFGAACPHLNTRYFHLWCPDVPHEMWLEADLRLLEACDAVLMLKWWQSSKGAQIEHEYALEHQVEVFYDIPSLERAYPVS